VIKTPYTPISTGLLVALFTALLSASEESLGVDRLLLTFPAGPELCSNCCAGVLDLPS